MAPDFTALYREHYPAVLRFVRRRAALAEVDDIVAVTFTTAWRKQDELAVAPLPWLYRTARNTMLNAARAAGRRSALHVQLAQDAAIDVVRDPAVLLGERQRLTEAWRHLDPLDREVLALQAWEGMTAAQSAAVIGISRAACSMRSSRARRRLATLLAAADADASGSQRPTDRPAPTSNHSTSTSTSTSTATNGADTHV
ncbi:RNA polymerase sigma factor [Curtobacterium sp. VKM Ac-2922]|uniref:RNA polymerase sigma factor n=1 Tax=Curtobacterium sp. VKM Ac-2922 TaxID=2929475 RepID=UPI001FB30BE9|nr:sigma-70 family RNA polymerase sigma factor [Curtobacterium sp. VKM Ac-2922]MCJ1714979.1 sigma-70 family RNA polymerase sigma factor [Curtobacterium sp. VKM Ac-2922]